MLEQEGKLEVKKTSAPYISIVVVARNDTYGGNFLQRMQLFLDWLFLLWQKYNLDAELVIVEWDPPQDSPRLKDVLTWPKTITPGMVRIIEVPSELHHRLPNSDRATMFEYIAKNVGIRRAKGEYILATNSDIIFSESLIKFLSQRRLSSSRFYRIDRYDVDFRVLTPGDISDLEVLCRKHWKTVYKRTALYERDPFKSYFMYKLWRVFVRPIIHPIDNVKDILCLFSDKYLILGRFLLPHCNAAGDFFLMARAHWHKIKGYRETTDYSWFLDSQMCFMAVACGLRQRILGSRFRIYHQEHDRTEQLSRPRKDWRILYEHGVKIMEERKLDTPNDETWGFASSELKEYDIA